LLFDTGEITDEQDLAESGRQADQGPAATPADNPAA
jgi:hypothetical protein